VPNCLSEVGFGSFLAYSPKGSSELSRRSRTWTYNIKQDKEGAIARVVDALAREIAAGNAASVLRPILTPTALLVPCPRSAPLVGGGLWPSERIAQALKGRGFGADVAPILKRRTPIRASSTAPRGERPSVQEHIDTMDATDDRVMYTPREVVVVDDVVTKGSTLLAAASWIRELYPDAEVKTFALVRTLGLQPEIDTLIASCGGTIRYAYGKAVREP
jgi:predicted amidophosphoribosyltransferase